MRYSLEKKRISYLVKNRNGYLVLAGVSLLLNLLLVSLLFLMSEREKIIIVPPSINKSFWVSSSSVSEDYLSEMTMFLASISLNLTPGNVARQNNMLLRYVDPSYYLSLKRRLIKLQEKVNKHHITMTFHPSDIKVNAHKLIARITGDMEYDIGGIASPKNHITYEFRFSYKHGQLRVIGIPEVKQNG
jgi:conjugal transfer pilus assembly protein TraE